MTRIPLVLLLLAFTLNIFAQPEMDDAFGAGGKALFQFGATGTPADLAVQADNKIVLVGTCFNINLGDRPFCAIRANENGSLDSNFRSQPTFLGAYFSFGRGVNGVAIQNDGKVVAVGWDGTNAGENLAMVRWNANGSADTTFGISGNGTVATDVTPMTADRAKKVLVQPDGKILVVGRTSSSLFVARYTANGVLDPSFGIGGVAKVSALLTTTGQSIALQGDGKILAGGATTSTTTGAFLLARLNADGTPDNSWDADGIAMVGFSDTGENAGFRSIALQADGRVVAIGHSNVLYRFNSDGTPDLNFDVDGFRTALDGSLAEPHDVVISPGGFITVVGEKIFIFGQPDVFDYLTARYLPTGAPDTSYSGDGFLDIHIFNNDGARAAQLDTFGRVALGGRSTPGTTQFPFENPQFSGARLDAAPGGAVGVSGRVVAADGRGVFGVMISLTGGGGVRTVITNPFGYYRFTNVAPGQVYRVTVDSKRHQADGRDVFVGDNVVNFDFVAQEP